MFAGQVLLVKSSTSCASYIFKVCRPSHTLACVSDDVIKDYKPLKLQLELTVGILRQRFCLKPTQPEICILVPINKKLERTRLETEIASEILSGV